MKRRHWQWFASLFLLLVFLGSKSMEYHTVSHQDADSAECEWCDFALLLQTIPFEPAPETAPYFPLVVSEEKQPLYGYTLVFVAKGPYFRNFSRPPPSLL